MTGISLLQRFKAAKAGELPRVVEQPEPQPRYNGVQRELTVSGNSVFAIRIAPDRFADLVECQLSGIGLRKLSRKNCAGLLRQVRRDVREAMRDPRYGIVACGEFSAAQAEVDRSDIATWSASVYLLRISDTPIHQRKTPVKPERFRGEPLTIQDEKTPSGHIVDMLRGWIEHAPENPGKLAENLAGWSFCGDGKAYSEKPELYLCATCAGRIISRGFSLPRGFDPAWEQTEGVDLPDCCTCGKSANSGKRYAADGFDYLTALKLVADDPQKLRACDLMRLFDSVTADRLAGMREYVLRFRPDLGEGVAVAVQTILDERKAADDRWNAINGDKPEWKSDAPGWTIERVDYVDGGTVRWHLSPCGGYRIGDKQTRFWLQEGIGKFLARGVFPTLAKAVEEYEFLVGKPQPEPQSQPATTPAPPIASIGTNNSGTSIRLSFTDKPDSQILASLRAAGFRWNRTGKYWYHKDTPENREAVERITGVGIDEIAGSDGTREAGSAELPELPKVRETSKTSPAIDTQAIAQKFRTKAEQLAPKVEHLLRPMDSNPTAKRIGQYHSRRLDGERLDRVQEAFEALADLWERGIDAVPEALRDYRKPTMDALSWMAKQTTHVSNGYHGYLAETHDWKPIADLREARIAGALRDLIDPRKQEERKRELELRTKLDALRLSDIPGFFPTPDAIIDEMIERAEIEKGHHVLEPSAGIGSIADKVAAVVGDGRLVLCEVRSSLCEILKNRQHLQPKEWTKAEVKQCDFLEQSPAELYDRVLMNPPFENGQDGQHVQHAFQFLRPGGRLVAIVSAGLMFRQNRKAQAFREWLEAVDGEVIDVDGSHYRSVQAFRQTGCECKMLVVDKRE